MKKTTRIKPQAEVIASIDAADAALKSIGEAERELARIKADMEDEVAEIKETAKESAKPFKLKVKLLGDALKNFFYHRSADFLKGGAKSIQLTHGVIGMRKTPPKLECMKGYTDDLVVGELHRMGRTDAIRTVETLNKEALAKWTDADLASIGMERVQDDEFFLKPSTEVLGEVA